MLKCTIALMVQHFQPVLITNMAATKKTVIKESQAAEFTMGKAVFYLGAAAGAAFGIWWLANRAGSQSSSDNLFADPNIQLATRIHNALNPGMFTNTDEASLFKIAGMIKDFSAVSQAYAKLYSGANLTQDLDANLDAVELQTFMQAVTSGKRASQLRAEGKIPTDTGYLYNVTQLTVNGKVVRVGSAVNAKGIAGPYYKDVNNYPLNYSGLNYKATGKYTVLAIYGYTDDLDKTKNTFLFKVQQGSTIFWQRFSAFNA